MKLPKNIRVTNTVRLFHKEFKYKIVFVTGNAFMFRLPDHRFNFIIENRFGTFNSEEKKDLLRLKNILQHETNYRVRVEGSLMSIYSNDELLIQKLAKEVHLKIKYVSRPLPEAIAHLEQNKIVTKTIDEKYKVVLNEKSKDFSSFVEWCKNNDKVRISDNTLRRLLKNRRSEVFFYVKDEKCLTLVKLMIGDAIRKVEEVTKI